MNKLLEKKLEGYRTETAYNWFTKLRNKICSAIEEIELDAPSHSLNSHISPGKFKKTKWDRNAKNGGGGTMAILHGRVFEKVGVNISLVKGKFPDHFKKKYTWSNKRSILCSNRNISSCTYVIAPYTCSTYEYKIYCNYKIMVWRRL